MKAMFGFYCAHISSFKDKHQWNLNQNTIIFIQEDALKMSYFRMVMLCYNRLQHCRTQNHVQYHHRTVRFHVFETQPRITRATCLVLNLQSLEASGPAATRRVQRQTSLPYFIFLYRFHFIITIINSSRLFVTISAIFHAKGTCTSIM